MADRHALLIGVPTYDNDLFGPLPGVVAADVRRMSDALRQSGYQVRHCGEGDSSGQEPTGNRIRAALARALREAPEQGVLVLYFSGHGVVIDRRSYLVPQDVYAGPDGLDVDGLVPIVPRHLEHCAARLVLFVVDACRNDLSAELTVLPHGGLLPYPGDGAFVLLNSCRPGERSLHGQDGSYFTQALAEVLDRRHSARTLGEVHRAVVRQLARKAARTRGLEQTPELVSAQGGSTAPDGVVICDGDRVGEAWRRAVEETPVWQRSTLDKPALDRVRKVVLDIVDDCARQWTEAQEQLTRRCGLRDPWSAQDYPVRVLAATHACLPEGADLRAVELAALVAVPFLRESALGAGLRLAATVRPDDFSRTYADGPRSDLEITHAIHEHVCRRAEGLARRGRTEPRDALAMWLVHRWIGDRSSLWEDPGVGTQCERLASAVSADPACALTERELCTILPVLMRCVDADAGDQLVIEQLRQRVFDPRMRTLGAALWLAGVMAADPRRMPTVVVDHVGIGAELAVPALHAATVKASWQRDGATIALHAVCDHPALLAAFTALVERATGVREVIGRLDLAAELTGNLPARFTAAGLRPEIHDGVPVFETPPPRFRLSDEKVRELLIGRQLYGEPDLAIRELYQNALDACRYRDTRRQYQRRLGRALTDWTGAISFRQDVDADGREFVECTDNGVGMSREALMRTFANAGERFVYRSGFRAEQARWQDLDPPLRLIPNSQFGVGVFSYFMIAEEIQIVTRPVGEDDVVDPRGYGVRIASSGSLFQITPSAEMPGGGTRVRLYLTGEDRISVLRTVRRLLWVAEYRVDVVEDGASSEVWQPEELRYPGATVEPLKHGHDLWWVPGEGGLAADGIRTNEERHGLVVNLRGQRRPQFTVDRNRLRSWDRDWINRQVRDSAPTLLSWSGLTLSWLWKVAESTPAVAEDIFTLLIERGHELPVAGALPAAAPAPASRIGCLPVDMELFTGDLVPLWDPSNMWLAAWRVGAWKGIAAFIGVEHIAEATRLDGFPLPRPMDAAVLTRIYEAGQRYRSPARYGRPSVDDLLAVAADEDEPPVLRLQRLRRYAITGLDLRAAREIPRVNHTFADHQWLPVSRAGEMSAGIEDEPLLLAVAAWAPPGQPARVTVGGWLASASSELHISLAEVVRRAGALVPPDWTPPNAGLLGPLADYVCTRNDVNLLSSGYGTAPWLGPVVSPVDVLRAGSRLGLGVPEVLAMFDRFAPLGYEVAGRHDYPADLSQVEHAALRHVERTGDRLHPLHLMVLTGQIGGTVHQVRAGLGRLAAAGLLRLPAEDPWPEAVLTDEERAILNEDLTYFDPRTNDNKLATGWNAIRVMARGAWPPDESGFEDRLTQRRRLLDLADPHRPVTMPEIVELTYMLDCTVAAAVEFYQRLFPATADLSALPTAAVSSSATCHRFEERLALLGAASYMYYNYGEVTWGLRAGDIVNGAQRAGQSITAFLDRFEPYRELGAPLPTLSGAERESLGERITDRHDRAMLTVVDGAGTESFVDEITPLYLIQQAGRFGWTPAEAHARMARLRPLGLTLRYPTDACPDRIVAWQDLLLLTTHLDGQEPSVSGPVTGAHLAAGAEVVSEPVERVRERLRGYAALFELSLPPEEESVA